jgi:rhodanese-related sulfurtransferase
MTPQTLYYVLFILIIVFVVRRMLQQKNIPHYSPSQLESRMKESAGMVLLDVRTKSERSAQHIAGSLHIPLNELAARIQELKKYSGREIVCYCQTGARSASAVALLLKNGLSAANLRGGIAEWNFHKLEK